MMINIEELIRLINKGRSLFACVETEKSQVCDLENRIVAGGKKHG